MSSRNRATIDAVIQEVMSRHGGEAPSRIGDRERLLWVENEDRLYTLACEARVESSKVPR